MRGVDGAKAVFNEKRCLQDEVTQRLCEQFPSEDSFASEDCLAIVQSLATVLETDIAAIERQHTISRKVIVSRSMARPVTLQTLSADFCLRQHAQRMVDGCSLYYVDGAAIRAKLARRQKKGPAKVKKQNQKKRKNSGGGGAFRAFLAVTTKGQKATASSWSQAGKVWRGLSPDQKAVFRNIGRLGTASHRRGFKSFGNIKKSSASGASLALDLGVADLSDPNLPLDDGRVSDQGKTPAESQLELVEWERPLAANSFLGPDALQAFHPEKELRDKMKEIRASSVKVCAQFATARDETLNTLTKFCKGGASLPPASSKVLLPGAPGVGEAANSFMPKPSKIPWLE